MSDHNSPSSPHLSAILALFSLAFVLCVNARPAAAREPQTTNLLIVGHSWTFLSGSHINTLVEPVGDMFALNVTHGGYSLRDQWNDPEQMAKITAQLESGIYDYAAIMDFASAVADPEGSGIHEAYAALFRDLFASYGVQTFLILPWEYVAQPDLQPTLTANEYAVAAALGAGVAPVGEAFELSKTLRPDLLLTRDDISNSHPSAYGAYLRDITLYSSILEKPPDELAGEEGIAPDDEAHFKSVAWQVIETFNGGGPPPTIPAPPSSTATNLPTADPTATLNQTPPSTATATQASTAAATSTPSPSPSLAPSTTAAAKSSAAATATEIHSSTTPAAGPSVTINPSPGAATTTPVAVAAAEMVEPTAGPPAPPLDLPQAAAPSGPSLASVMLRVLAVAIPAGGLVAAGSYLWLRNREE